MGVFAVPEDVDGRPLVLWSPYPALSADEVASASRALTSATRDAQGVPKLSSAQWWQLARAHAPTLWVETEGEADLIGAPLEDGGFDVAQHVVYCDIMLLRAQDGSLRPHLRYSAWFSADPKDRVDWRVMFDAGGWPPRGQLGQALRVQAGSHQLSGTVPMAEAHSKKRRVYRLRPWSELPQALRDE